MKLDKKTITWIILVVLAGIVSLVAVFIGGVESGNQADPSPANQLSISADATKFKKDYPKVNTDNRYVYAKPAEVLDIFEKGDGLVFLGFPECPWCQELAPIVDEAAKAEGIDKVYYLNIREARESNDELYKALVAKLSDYLEKDENGEPRIYVPDVTAFRDGEVVGRFKQESAGADEKVTPESFWSEERRKRGVEQLKQVISQTKPFAEVEKDIKNGAILLDVRTSQEFKEGHALGAVNLDLKDIQAGKTPEIAKDSKVYVYCRSGSRSAQAATALKRAGFTDVNDLGGLSKIEQMGAKVSK